MGIGQGAFKQVRVKRQTGFGVAPGTSGGQVLRTVRSDIDMERGSYAAAERTSTPNVADFRLGIRKSGGKISGELSPLTYADLFACILRRDFAAVTSLSSLTTSIATGATVGGLQSYTITRSAGDYFAGGIKAGDVVRLSAGNAANINKNLLVLAMTATVLTVITINNSALVPESNVASQTLSLPGKKNFVAPATASQADIYFGVEHWYPDVPSSELFMDEKVGAMSIDLPPTGIAKLDIDFMGSGAMVSSTSGAYYTSPTAATSTGLAAAANGVLTVGGVPIAICSGLKIAIDGGVKNDYPVVGASTMPLVTMGNKVKVTGNFSAFLADRTYRAALENETELSLTTVLTLDNTASADFMSFTLPRIKISKAAVPDAEGALVVNADFQALLSTTGAATTATEYTTLSMQDSKA